MGIVESINRYLAGSPVNKGERTRLTKARDEIVRLRESAAKYEWLRDNCASFSWVPSRYNAEKVTGFAAFNTDYCGFSFDEAIEMAMKK